VDVIGQDGSPAKGDNKRVPDKREEKGKKKRKRNTILLLLFLLK
jgi:hypothetical protein